MRKAINGIIYWYSLTLCLGFANANPFVGLSSTESNDRLIQYETFGFEKENLGSLKACQDQLNLSLSSDFDLYTDTLASSLEVLRKAIPKFQATVEYFEESLQFSRCVQQFSKKQLKHRELFQTIETDTLRKHDDLLKLQISLIENLSGGIAAALDKVDDNFIKDNLSLMLQVILENRKYIPTVELVHSFLQTAILSPKETLKLIKIAKIFPEEHSNLEYPYDFLKLIQLIVASPEIQESNTFEAVITLVLQRVRELTDDSRLERLRNQEFTLKWLKRSLKQTKDPEERQRLQKTIAEIELTIEKLELLQWSIDKSLMHLKDQVLAWTSISGIEFEKMIEKVKTKIDKSYLTLHGVELIHGDILVTVSEGGYGDLFTQVAGLPNSATHSGYVFKYYQEGFPVYAKAEISKTYLSNPYFDDHGLFIMRPNFEIPQYINAEMLKSLIDLGEYQFDTFFEPGFKPINGKVKLYCSEFVHFSFKNGFDVANSNRGISPFDDRDTVLEFTSEVGNENLTKLGMEPGTEVFPPSLLYYSKHLNFIGYQPSTYFARVNNSEPPTEQQQMQNDLIAKSAKTFNTKVAEYFKLYELQSATLEERVKFDLFILAQRFQQLRSRFLGKGSGQNGGMLPDLSDPNSKYQILKFFHLTQEFSNKALRMAFEEDRTFEEATEFIEQKTRETLEGLFKI